MPQCGVIVERVTLVHTLKDEPCSRRRACNPLILNEKGGWPSCIQFERSASNMYLELTTQIEEIMAPHHASR